MFYAEPGVSIKPEGLKAFPEYWIVTREEISKLVSGYICTSFPIPPGKDRERSGLQTRVEVASCM